MSEVRRLARMSRHGPNLSRTISYAVTEEHQIGIDDKRPTSSSCNGFSLVNPLLAQLSSNPAPSQCPKLKYECRIQGRPRLPKKACSLQSSRAGRRCGRFQSQDISLLVSEPPRMQGTIRSTSSAARHSELHSINSRIGAMTGRSIPGAGSTRFVQPSLTLVVIVSPRRERESQFWSGLKE